jgi:GNAT superfamily N-acetyltransferase
MPEQLAIRPATPADSRTILELIEAIAAYEKLSHEVVATEDLIRSHLFPSDGRRPYAECLLAELGGAPVAFALFFHNFSTFVGRPGMYLEDLFVVPEHRGKGIGKALLVRVAQLAVERGCGRMEWSVLDWNRPAIEFYESLGATPMNGWTVYRLAGEALAGVAGTDGE